MNVLVFCTSITLFLYECTVASRPLILSSRLLCVVFYCYRIYKKYFIHNQRLALVFLSTPESILFHPLIRGSRLTTRAIFSLRVCVCVMKRMSYWAFIFAEFPMQIMNFGMLNCASAIYLAMSAFEFIWKLIKEKTNEIYLVLFSSINRRSIDTANRREQCYRRIATQTWMINGELRFFEVVKSSLK